MNAQGWYQDPYRRHEERWYSGGTPTGLVRDRGVESTDPPPEAAPTGTLVRAEHEVVPGGRDLLRVGSR
jgi:hypothetical protein